MAALAGKRIGLLTARASRTNGGVFEAVVRQVDLLKTLDAQPVVVAAEDDSHAADAWRLAGAEIRLAQIHGPKHPGFAPRLTPVLLDAGLDLVHLHGIWSYASRAATRWSKATNGPLVISPLGMCDAWMIERNRWKKNLARLAWEKSAWSNAMAFHALTPAEAGDIGRECGAQLIGVIPSCASPPSQPRQTMPPPMVLYLGTIHEKKNLVALMEGWLAALPDLPPDASLVVAGWGDEEGVTALERFLEPMGPSIEFVSAAFASQKAALLELARFLVLPSSSEGLPISILDGWSAGIPAAISPACNLPEGYANGAALKCGPDRESIKTALIEALRIEEPEWLSMSRAAQALASGTFGKEHIAGQWRRIYEDCLGVLSPAQLERQISGKIPQ
ncbi:glycosyltransferase [Qipengyuania sp. G39]|uniref:Glycosyltransferase n=1 Tax=Qipengyuania profundimaris TaxID=3067652 RepID=A0ABT9HSA0_9SPHN|nr:glycosyltransferase [Qipengyuania sp. G39]MDP4575885.1 glycosyltransferase [Qipengyuania sp. G39]